LDNIRTPVDILVLLICRAFIISSKVIGLSEKYKTPYRRPIDVVMPYRFIFLAITCMNLSMVSSYFSQSCADFSFDNMFPSVAYNMLKITFQFENSLSCIVNEC